MFDLLTHIAHDAGRLALDHFGRLTDVVVEEKGPLDLVTIADRAVEALVTERLRAAFPADGIMGEEGARHPGTSGRVWVIDPIDGTFNFVRGGRQWAVSIGLIAEGRPIFGIVHAPAAGVTLAGGLNHLPLMNGQPLPPLGPFRPARGVVGLSVSPLFASAERQEILRRITDEAGLMLRICNASTWSLIELATGEVDGHIGFGERAWDVMGALPVVMALGAQGTLDWSATPLMERLRHVVGKPDLVALCQKSGII